MMFSLLQLPGQAYAKDELDVHADAAIIIEPTTNQPLEKYYMRKMKMKL